MALAGSLQLSHDLGLCRSQCYNKQFKSSVAGRGQLRLLSCGLCSRNLFQRRGSLSFHLADIAYRSIRSVPYKYNGIRCHSSMVPVKTLGFANLKTAAVELVRSLNAVQVGGPLHKLVPAVGLILFTIWGLGPLLRLSRNLLLRKSESSWKNSSTHYVLTSYIQPLLLWTGAMLVCRALDPVVLPSEASQVVKQRFLNFIGSLSTVLAFAYCLSSVIQQSQKIFTESNDSNDTRKMGYNFAGKAVYYAVWVAAFSLFMELLGFSTQKWLTAGGLGTLMLTIAGREILINFLSSAVIHTTQPFIVNDWIQTKIQGYDVSGFVEHVGWWSPTIVRGEDGEAVHIPNHKFTVNIVRNLSQKSHWRIKTRLAISHLDAHKINIIVADMRKVLAKKPQIEQQRLHRRVFLEQIDPENQALVILISCFVKTPHHEEYLCVQEAVLLDLLRVISHHRARLATPIRTVQKRYSDPDLENVPFAESIYNHSGVASDCPLLLIEPSYRINSEDRAKTSTRATGVQDGKSTAHSSQDNKTETKVGEKLDLKSGEVSGSGSTKDPEDAAASISNPKVGEKGTTKQTSKPVPETNLNAAEMSSSGSRELNLDPDQSKKTETGADKASGTPVTPQLKQEGERLPVVQPPITREENIVLGVALEGAKRTLPIGEEVEAPAEEKELAAHRSKNGSTIAEKDKKDGQVSAAPGATPGDQ